MLQIFLTVIVYTTLLQQMFIWLSLSLLYIDFHLFKNMDILTLLIFIPFFPPPVSVLQLRPQEQYQIKQVQTREHLYPDPHVGGYTSFPPLS